MYELSCLCHEKYKDMHYNNSLTSSHYQIERGLKRKADDQFNTGCGN